jgi:hypothetical protein
MPASIQTPIIRNGLGAEDRDHEAKEAYATISRFVLQSISAQSGKWARSSIYPVTQMAPRLASAPGDPETRRPGSLPPSRQAPAACFSPAAKLSLMEEGAPESDSQRFFLPSVLVTFQMTCISEQHQWCSLAIQKLVAIARLARETFSTLVSGWSVHDCPCLYRQGHRITSAKCAKLRASDKHFSLCRSLQRRSVMHASLPKNAMQ